MKLRYAPCLLLLLVTTFLLGGFTYKSAYADAVSTNVVTPFSDVADTNPNAEYISDLYYKKVIDGTGETTFSPQSSLTREQFAKFVTLAFKIPLSNDTAVSFRDLENDWSIPYVTAAFKAGIIDGTSLETFEPTSTLTREAAATIVWRWLKQQIPEAGSLPQTQNVSDSSSWAKEAVNGIMLLGLRAEGVSTQSYQAQSTMNRGDAAALISKAQRYIEIGHKTNTPPTIQYTSLVKTELWNHVVSYSSQELVLSVQNQAYKMGEIIVLPPNKQYPLGLALKITKALSDGNTNTVYTVEEPTFDEIISTLKVTGILNLNENTTIYIPDEPEYEVQALSTNISKKKKPKLDLKMTENELKVGLKDLQFENFKVNGEVALKDAKLLVDLDYSLNEFHKSHLELIAKHESKVEVSYSGSDTPNPLKVKLGRFILPIPNTPLGIQFQLLAVLKVDGTFSLVLTENGFMDVGVNNGEAIRNFNARMNMENTEAAVKITGTASINLTTTPTLFQVSTDIIAIDQSLLGAKVEYKAEINMNPSGCTTQKIDLYSDGKLKLQFAKKDVDLSLYEIKKNLFENTSCQQKKDILPVPYQKVNDYYWETDSKNEIDGIEIKIIEAFSTNYVMAERDEGDEYYIDNFGYQYIDPTTPSLGLKIPTDHFDGTEQDVFVVKVKIKNNNDLGMSLPWILLFTGTEPKEINLFSTSDEDIGVRMLGDLEDEGRRYDLEPKEEREGYWYFPYLPSTDTVTLLISQPWQAGEKSRTLNASLQMPSISWTFKRK